MLASRLLTRIKILERVFLSLGFFWVSLTAMEPTMIQQTLTPYQTFEIPLNLNADDYVRGEYQTSAMIKSITLVDENKMPIRRLSEPFVLEEQFRFTATHTGTYTLVIEASESESIFTCKLETLIPEASKQEIPHEEITSPTLLSMKGVTDTQAFWEQIQRVGTPLIEEKENGEYLLTFLYRGAKNNIQIMGAPIGDITSMNKMRENDIWYKSFSVPKGTRLSYQLAPDVPMIEGTPRERRVAILATLQADPFNQTPMASDDKFHTMSTVELPHQHYTDWSKATREKQGTIQSYTLQSSLLNNQRAIDVYLPKGFSKAKTYPVLFVFDGKEYQSKVQTPVILDNLIAAHKVPPLIAVFIANPSYQSRAVELPCNPLFADFMAHELLPWFKKTISPHLQASQTIVSGSSYGGLASAYTAFRYPELFGKVLSLSGSFWWKPDHDAEMEWLTKEIAQTKTLPISFYMYAGLFETGQSSIDILESNRHLRTVLNAKHNAVFYEEFAGGHDYFSWSVALADGLVRIFSSIKAQTSFERE
jgi:enterochelin esterase-like enzyme